MIYNKCQSVTSEVPEKNVFSLMALGCNFIVSTIINRFLYAMWLWLCPFCVRCEIDWKKGKDVTVKTIKKKQKHKGRGTVRTVTKQVPNDSFFNFFNPIKGTPPHITLTAYFLLFTFKATPG